ncbi:PREDICTED: uncharacterized protein K02A2.6-like [Nicotiana attenuata]|uniref:uncharacterized protein K02A2.6-like n=1 Tax=Nicotiana attenuata TaxID=49451 RepID=UPI0009053BDF|nr:PREDICTED: uncharacterized protein K02A2.6-like [Nicotiana attenuata]
MTKGIEVDKAKIDLIAGLSTLTTVKDYCRKAFEFLKEQLTNAPIVVSPDWSQPFEIMCDASDIAEDDIIRRCVPETEMKNILSYCHDGAVGGHYGGRRTAAKALEIGFFWPTLFKDAKICVASCDKCQRTGNISKRYEMHLNSIVVCELFDVWGIDFMGPCPPSNGYEYILVAVDYVSKCVEAIATKKNNARVVCDFLKKNIFSSFRTPRIIISDQGTHFINRQFASLLSRYGVTHKTGTPYHA